MWTKVFLCLAAAAAAMITAAQVEAFTTTTTTTLRLRQRNLLRPPFPIATARNVRTTRANNNDDDVSQVPWVFESVAKLGGNFGGLVNKNKNKRQSDESHHDQVLHDLSLEYQHAYISRSVVLIAAYAASCLHMVRKGSSNNLAAAILGSSHSNNLLPFLLVGQILVAGMVSYVIRAAGKNNRLASDTYKRLNLILVMYGLNGLERAVAATTTTPFTTRSILTQKNPVTTLLWVLLQLVFLPLVTIMQSLKGYVVGVNHGSWIFEEETDRHYIKDATTQISGMIQTLLLPIPLPRNLASLVYWTASVTTLASLLSVITASSPPAAVATTSIWFQHLVHRSLLGPLTGLYIILKNAADRNRLEGTTFIGLNCFASGACAFVSAAMRRGMIDAGSSALALSRAMGVFSFATGLFAVAGLLAKKRKHKHHDESFQHNSNSVKLRDDFPLLEE